MCNVYINVKLYVYLIVHGFPSMCLMIISLLINLRYALLSIFPLNQFEFKLHYLAYIIFMSILLEYLLFKIIIV